MATPLGKTSDRLVAVRALLSPKGRREQGRFAFEGATLLAEAQRSGFPVSELYVTRAAYESVPAVRDSEAGGATVYLVDERSAERLSDLESPSGVVAVAPIPRREIASLFTGDGRVLVLADVNDPGNAGTLLRSADAFGCRGVLFGRDGVDPYHPKVVRGAMGAIFRVPVAIAGCIEAAQAAQEAGFELAGLAAGGEPIGGIAWPARAGIVVGNERHGLGQWAGACRRLIAIPMAGAAESLNAAVAGSIALFAASRGNEQAVKRVPEA